MGVITPSTWASGLLAQAEVGDAVGIGHKIVVQAGQLRSARG